MAYNIIFYFTDQQRWDTCGCFGQPLDITPNLDALAAQAAGCCDSKAAAEGKILLAEYALDFALEAANRALLLSMEAIDTQLTSQEQERSLS